MESLTSAPATASIEPPEVAGSPFLGQQHHRMHHRARHPHLHPEAISSTYSLAARSSAAMPTSAQGSSTDLHVQRPRTAAPCVSPERHQGKAQSFLGSSHATASEQAGLTPGNSTPQSHVPLTNVQRRRPNTAQPKHATAKQAAFQQQQAPQSHAAADAASESAVDSLDQKLQSVQYVENQMHSDMPLAEHWEGPQLGAAGNSEPLQQSVSDQCSQIAAVEGVAGPVQVAADTAQHSTALQDGKQLHASLPEYATQQSQPCRTVAAGQSSCGGSQSESRPRSRAACRAKPKLQMQVVQRSIGRSFSSGAGAGPLFSAKVQWTGNPVCTCK